MISFEDLMVNPTIDNGSRGAIIPCSISAEWVCTVEGHPDPNGCTAGGWVITVGPGCNGSGGGGGGSGSGSGNGNGDGGNHSGGGGGSGSGSGTTQTVVLEICDGYTNTGDPGNSEDCEDDYAAYFTPYICEDYVDFELTNSINNWASNPFNRAAATDLVNYLATNYPEGEEDNCVELDIEHIVILDREFVDNNCLYGVYEDMGKAATFNNYLQNFEGSMSVANLRFSLGVDSTYPNANAVTYSPINYQIEIKFNPNKLNRPPLDVTRTFIHEMIHAEIYRKLLSLAKQGAIPWSSAFIESIRNDYPGLHDYYMRYYYNMPNGIPLGNPQHEMMAQHYKSIVIAAMKEYDNSFSNEIYEALSWMGLMGSGPVNPLTGLPPNPTAAWANLPLQQRLNLISIRNNFVANNLNCE